MLLYAVAIPGLFPISSCSFFGLNQKPDRRVPIENPFIESYNPKDAVNQGIVLRTKKGDRSIEVELPAGKGDLTDFVVPMSPHFKETVKGGTYRGGPSQSGDSLYDDSYRETKPGYSDREIMSNMSRGTPEDEAKRREVEGDLGIMASEDEVPGRDLSYLAALDRIKQLYKLSRLEAALLEIDQLIPKYQTDNRLFKMRGTILDRLGYRDLALKSWMQSLKLNPGDRALKKLVDRRRSLAGAAEPGGVAP